MNSYEGYHPGNVNRSCIHCEAKGMHHLRNVFKGGYDAVCCAPCALGFALVEIETLRAGQRWHDGRYESPGNPL